MRFFAASQAGSANARKSASVYPAARNTAVGDNSRKVTARWPARAPSGWPSPAIRPSATTATAPLTREISSPATVQSGMTVCTARRVNGKPGKKATRLSEAGSIPGKEPKYPYSAMCR